MDKCLCYSVKHGVNTGWISAGTSFPSYDNCKVHNPFFVPMELFIKEQLVKNLDGVNLNEKEVISPMAKSKLTPEEELELYQFSVRTDPLDNNEVNRKAELEAKKAGSAPKAGIISRVRKMMTTDSTKI